MGTEVADVLSNFPISSELRCIILTWLALSFAFSRAFGFSFAFFTMICDLLKLLDDQMIN
ncbi:MAG: hypothetical protein VX153_08970 [Verrucomicrobiota bacterium]|nr:hypothetical protein [Verrucomicrobiota bacterium]